MVKHYWVYLITNKPYGTLYIGVTSDLQRRIYEHREGLYDGFSKKYGLKILVHYEECQTALEAIAREKELKTWNRQWKKNLIEKQNPCWLDLYNQLNL